MNVYHFFKWYFVIVVINQNYTIEQCKQRKSGGTSININLIGLKVNIEDWCRLRECLLSCEHCFQKFLCIAGMYHIKWGLLCRIILLSLIIKSLLCPLNVLHGKGMEGFGNGICPFIRFCLSFKIYDCGSCCKWFILVHVFLIFCCKNILFMTNRTKRLIVVTVKFVFFLKIAWFAYWL